MNEILLTPVQIADFNEKFWKEHTSNQSSDTEAEYDRELCRAQVRKIADWLENNPETDIDAGTLIALRKAAGEGK